VRWLIDTSIIIRWLLPQDAQHQVTRAAILELRRRGYSVYITAQNITEFWSVATRPRNVNGLGMTPEQAQHRVQLLLRAFVLLPETPEIFPFWFRLVNQHSVSGRQVHDTRLVAVMMTHGATHLPTFNHTDFARFSALITPVNPLNGLP
jgi:predicted nucleic acid-binding protein